MRSKRQNRRGIVLLVCLVMLVLFLLLGITFTLTASQFRIGASAYAAAHTAHDDGYEVCDAALMDMIRGTNSPYSPMRGYSLFGGVYGEERIRGTLTTSPPVPATGNLAVNGCAPLPATSGQFVAVALNPEAAGSVLSPINGYYAGCVMTMLNGTAGNQSRRIVDYIPASGGNPAIFHVDTFITSGGLPAVGDMVLINGRPFSGTGNGYNPVTGRTDAMDNNNRQYALLPNLAYFAPTATYLVPGGMGGMNPGYTAPDANHPWLAAGDPGATSGRQIKPSWHDPALISYWINKSGGVANANFSRDLMRQISFRPLGKYWNDLKGIADADVNNANYADHPKFTGSNPFFAAIPPALTTTMWAWDVDNDGDGIPDSIWINPGYPVRRTSDGRLYVPLVAMYIRDLDGCVNLNAHGTLDMGDPKYLDQAAGRFAGGTAISAVLPPGQGYGPPEINPILLLSAGNAAEMATATAQYKRLLEGGQVLDVNGNGTLDAAAGDRDDVGRFGAGKDLNGNNAPDPGEYAPGIPGQLDTLNRLLWANRYGAESLFGTVPFDLRGVNRISLTHRGQPAFHLGVNSGQWYDTQYEQDTSRTFSTSRNDSPFTAAEFEPLYRQYDADAGSLPIRLSGLAPLTMGFRDSLTFASKDIPVPSVTAPRALREILRQNGEIARHIPDLLRARIIKEHITANAWTLPLNAGQVTQVNGEVNMMIATPSRMLAADLLAGLRFDVNRLFGNGVDDNGNGLIDEPAEAPLELVYPAAIANFIPAGPVHDQFSGIPFDYNSEGLDPNNATSRILASRVARQEYAKQLYVLLMLMADEESFPTLITETGLSDAQKYELVAQRLAQFAINVVDYRDADSVCTPFEYDLHPFNGWDPNCDGVIYPDPSTGGGLAESPVNAPDRRVVWGCEAPALLLSDSLSFHNIRTKDDTDVPPPPAVDPHYDQKALPQGSTFIELYSPANPHLWAPGADGKWGVAGTNDDNNGVVDDISEAGWPGSDDVYIGSRDIHTSDGRVDLSMKDANGLPIWRLAISAPHVDTTTSVTNLLQGGNKPFSTTIQPEKINTFTNDTVTIERVVWFCNTDLAGIAAGVLPDSEKQKVFYNRANTVNTPVYLAPGRYLVVGPRAATPLGKKTDGTTDSPQRIELNPTANPPVNVFDLTEPNGVSTMPTIGTQIQAPQVIICAADRPATWVAPAPVNTPPYIGLNISEPLPNGGGYYPEPPDLPNNDNKYPSPQDMPLDNPGATNPTPASLVYASGKGTTENFRTAFLQRLADPTSPFHPVTNPYLTVDFMPLDLTMFNGDAAQFDAPPIASGTVKFRSRERGLPDGNFNIWAPATAALNPPSAAAGTTNFFDYQLAHSMGYLNSTFGAPITQAAGLGTTTVGDPTTPFPWLNWFDRPYVSQYELLMVPASSPARLNFEFSNAQTLPGDPYTGFYFPYRHLLDFFQTSKTAGQAAQLGRVFEYLCVPSKYPESCQILNAKAFSDNTTGTVGKGNFRPPFNVLSRYSEPGKMNLNTIFSPLVYASLANGTPMPSWATFFQSRRGFAASSQFSDFDPTIPSCFGNPFRAQTEWDLNADLPAAREADVTLLRPDPTDALKPLLAAITPEDYRRSDKNPYFRYQPLNRLGNLTTTRSNVFAVWITVGYFEVEPNPGGVDAAHPDGYRLTTELGIDTGEVRRHKSFYIIDRTVPVGYESGRDYNTPNAILLKTHIE